MKNVLTKLGCMDVFLTVDIADVSTAEDVYVAVPVTGILKKAYCAIAGAVVVGDSVLTFSNPTGAMTEKLTIAYAGSAAGDVFSATFANQANRKFAAGERLKIACDGGSTDAAKGKVTLVFERSRI